MRFLRLIFSIALASATLPLAGANAGFAPTNEEIHGGLQLATTGLGMDAKGNSLIAWDEDNLAGLSEVKARRLAADGALGPILDLAPGDIASQPRLAMTAAGRAFVAWESEAVEGANAGVRGRWVEPDGTLGPMITLIEGGVGIDAIGVRVVVDPAGVATVSWENLVASTLSMRRVRPDSLFGTLVPDVSNGTASEQHETVALPNGSTVVVWDSGIAIEKNVLTDTLAFGAPEKISETGGARIPGIAVDGLGNALVVWRQITGADNAVRGRFLGPSGAPAGGELTVDPLQAGSVGLRIRVAADSAGDFVVAWTRGVATNTLFFARAAQVGGAFGGPAQPLSAGLASATAQQAVIFDIGGGAAAWENDIEAGDITFGRAIDAAAAPTGDAQPLFGDGSSTITVASAPVIGIATFLIEFSTGGSSEAVVARRYLLPPSCVDSTSTVIEGRPVVVPLACTGAGIESATTLTAPQHGAVTFDRAASAFTYTPEPGFEGSDSFDYAAANDGGGSAAARVTVAVSKDTVKPQIQRLRVLKKVSRSDPPRFSKIRFELALSEAATVRIAVQKRTLVRGKARFRGIGSVSTKQAGLGATVRVTGKLARKMAAGGRFRVRAVATDLARNESKPRKLSLKLGV